jgi:hypothetical protein
MRFIGVYFAGIALATFIALPPAAEGPMLLNADIVSPLEKNCTFGVHRIDDMIDAIGDEAGVRAAAQELEIARNMRDGADYRGCVTYVDNALRALKTSAASR